MNKILYILLFWIYFLFIEYVTKMISFDFRKYILKDKYLQDLKFSYNWVEKYAEKKAFDKLKKSQSFDGLKIINKDDK